MRHRLKLLAILWSIWIIVISLTSCSSSTYLEAEHAISKRTKTTRDLLAPAHVVVTDEAYIDSKPVFTEIYPSWTAREVSVDLNGNTVRLKALMAELFKATGDVRVTYQDGIEDVDIKDIVLNGKLYEAIKEISKHVNYHFIIKDNTLTWTPKKTKIFQLGILPGEVNYMMGGATSSSATGFGAIVGSGIKGGEVTYKNSAGGSVWETLTRTLDKLVSKPDGSYVINKDASVVTVIDRPNNMDAISDYVKKFNDYHMQQVGIKIQVLEVELNDEHKKGIDWDIIRNTQNTLAADLSKNISPLASILPNVGGVNLTATKLSGKYAGTNAVIQYLEQQGNLTVLSEPRFTVLNNQIAEIKITTDQGYVKSRTDTITSLGTSQVALEPGSIKTGFSLYLVPTIFDSEVLLQITTSISRKVGLEGFSTAGSSTAQDLQLPTISDRRFTQRSVIPNNSTLVLTGFKSIENSTGDMTPFKVNFLGGQGATNKSTEIVILITPVIIRG